MRSPAGFARHGLWSLRARSARPSEASGESGPRRASPDGGEGRSPSLIYLKPEMIARITERTLARWRAGVSR